jgi:signal transduction histidine kinase
MRLADFIWENKEPILVQWEAFAATLLPAAAGLTSFFLRDHAPGILEAVATDLATPQTSEEQLEKSKGLAPTIEGAPETAAQTHALLRARAGFDINQLVAEYRALRASVVRLWMNDGPLDQNGLEDMIRFNEAIDQAIVESVRHFHAEVEQARHLLLGTLGHDMRSPLATILATASRLAGLNAGEKVSAAATRLMRCGESMQALLNELVDFSRTNLGVGIHIVPRDMDLVSPVTEELDQLRGAHPDRRIELTVVGDCRGEWDRLKLQQLLRNLVSNAIEYGAADMPVRVALRGDEAEVRLEVTNSGPPINSSAVREIFDPLKRGMDPRDRDDGPHLGLGLFIVREIVRAHGGGVEVSSYGGETTFAVRLPRQPRAMLT